MEVDLASQATRANSGGDRTRASRPEPGNKAVIYRDMEQFPIFRDLSDSQVIAEVDRLAKSERGATANLVAAIGEMDVRRLYLGQGCSSMFTYCTQMLHLAEHAAYNRIEAARTARKFPAILGLLADGRVHLSAVRLLAPHLTGDNHAALLNEASHKSKREIEQIVARLLPRADVRTSVRKVPARRVSIATVPPLPRGSAPMEVMPESPIASPPVQRPRAEPLAPGRYKLQFTVGEETYQKLRRAQDLLRHYVQTGDPAEVFDRALTLLLANLERTKFAATPRPRARPTSDSRSRYVPADIRRAVWARDGGRCRFEGAAGRCRETALLEFHHVVPYAHGGPTTVDNLQLRCANHNRYEAEQCFGLFVRERADIYSAVCYTPELCPQAASSPAHASRTNAPRSRLSYWSAA